jgi:hypothetical protein
VKYYSGVDLDWEIKILKWVISNKDRNKYKNFVAFLFHLIEPAKNIL